MIKPVAPAQPAPQPPTRAPRPETAKPVVAPQEEAVEASPFGDDDFGVETATEPKPKNVQSVAEKPAAAASVPLNAPATKSVSTKSFAPKTTTSTKKAASISAPIQVIAPKKERGFPHFLYLSITLCTLGAGVLVWLPHFLIYRLTRKKKKAEPTEQPDE
jgi:hypothetical protein